MIFKALDTTNSAFLEDYVYSSGMCHMGLKVKCIQPPEQRNNPPEVPCLQRLLIILKQKLLREKKGKKFRSLTFSGISSINITSFKAHQKYKIFQLF